MSSLTNLIPTPQPDVVEQTESLGSLAIRLARLAAAQHRATQTEQLTEHDSHRAAAEGLDHELRPSRHQNVAASTGKEAC